jgi:hypothetical protein
MISRVNLESIWHQAGLTAWLVWGQSGSARAEYGGM